MELRIRQTEDPPGLAVAGEVDLSTAHQLEAAMAELVAAGGPVTLDLSQVAFVDSTGIRVLLTAAARLAGRGELIILGPTPPVADVLRLIRADVAPGLRVVPIAPRGTPEGDGDP